eukprot:109639-Chlamydomonas_euryale.AAC.2
MLDARATSWTRMRVCGRYHACWPALFRQVSYTAGAARSRQHRPGSTVRAARSRQHRPGSTVRAARSRQHRPGSNVWAATSGQHRSDSTVWAAPSGQHRPGSTVQAASSGQHCLSSIIRAAHMYLAHLPLRVLFARAARVELSRTSKHPRQRVAVPGGARARARACRHPGHPDGHAAGGECTARHTVLRRG